MSLQYSDKTREKANTHLDTKMTFPKLVLVKSKYGTAHYLANSKENLLDIALFQLKANLSNRFYDAYGEKYDTIEDYIAGNNALYANQSRNMEPVTVELYHQWFGILENGSLGENNEISNMLKRRIKSILDSYTEQNMSHKTEAFVREMVANKDKLGAYLFLNSRRDHEYEGFIVDNFDQIS